MSHKHQKINISATDILKEKSLKVTKNRIRILDFLISESKPMSIEDIFKKLKNMDQVTIYRTINQFVQKGLVYQTDFRSGKAYFEFQNHHHHHIVCKGCGDLEEIDICVPESFLNKVQKQSRNFGTISEHALEFFGTCRHCDKI